MPRRKKPYYPQGWIKIPACVAMLLFLALPVFCQSNTTSLDYSFDVWQTEDGLPYNSVTAVVQTRDGFIWAGTYNGLVRFDGARFRVFDASNTPQLKSSRVTSLFEDADGVLWIGCETGDLTKFANDVFTNVTPGGAWPGGEIIGINDDSSGNLWLLNNNGWLFRLKDAYSIPAPKDSVDKPLQLVRGRRGKLWSLRVSALGSFDNESGVSWQAPLGEGTNAYQRACASRDGGLWVVGNGRIKKWNAEGWTKDLGPVPWGANTAMAMLETKYGDVLVGTLEAGLFIFSPDGSYRQFSRTNGLSHNWVRCLAEDREGNVWVGTGGGGLAALRARTVSMVKVPGDWDGRAVLGVTPSVSGGVWVGTEGAGIYNVTDTDSSRTMVTNGLWNAFDWSVLEEPNGKLWVGSWGSGLFYRQGDQFFQPPGIDYNAAITALYLGRDGALWLGTPEGLGRYADGNATWHTRKDGLAVPDVRTITEDSTGAIWFGMSGGGLGELKDGKISQYRKATNGLTSDFVWSLLSTEDDTLWIGTFGGGLCRLKNGKFSAITTDQGLPNNVICHIADDHKGDYWVSSYGGIFRVSKSDLNACADGRTNFVYCFTYGKADGLATLECSGGFQPTGCQTSDGRLWFPTSKGLAVVDPAKVTVNPLQPPVVIEDVTVDDKLTAIPQTTLPTDVPRLVIPAGRQRFEFRYAGLSFVAPEKVRFKYRLENLESKWVDAGSRRVAYYSFLKPGDYRLHVLACNNDGVWSENGAVLDFTVQPHFWQTWWFSCLSILAGAGVVGGTARTATRRRLREKMEKLERQRALERERARIAQDIHDDLGASLTRIIFLSQSAHGEIEETSPAVSDLNQIYLTARELTRAMDEIVWAVSPQHDTLDSLVQYLGKFAQDFLSVAGVRCRLDVPIALPQWSLTAEIRHNLFLAFKEALHNVLKHASANEVRVSLVPGHSSFGLLVYDNGKGFDPAQALPATVATTPIVGSKLRYSSGNGLANMKRRLEEIGGSCEIKSTPGEGTQVKFVVNLKN